METEKRLKMLQLFYAGVLADSVRRYSEAGILADVEAQKENFLKIILQYREAMWKFP